jgi:hypothetical protein
MVLGMILEDGRFRKEWQQALVKFNLLLIPSYNFDLLLSFTNILALLHFQIICYISFIL